MCLIHYPDKTIGLMYCRKCKEKMVEQKRVFHKKRKWICPRCGSIRFQVIRKDDGQKR